eukprot:765367-Hanusia_phi.AAC.1
MILGCVESMLHGDLEELIDCCLFFQRICRGWGCFFLLRSSEEGTRSSERFSRRLFKWRRSTRHEHAFDMVNQQIEVDYSRSRGFELSGNVSCRHAWFPVVSKSFVHFRGRAWRMVDARRWDRMAENEEGVKSGRDKEGGEERAERRKEGVGGSGRQQRGAQENPPATLSRVLLSYPAVTTLPPLPLLSLKSPFIFSPPRCHPQPLPIVNGMRTSRGWAVMRGLMCIVYMPVRGGGRGRAERWGRREGSNGERGGGGRRGNGS